ncbi:PQQ-binding-like beta-propeller repeat protein [Ruania alba]|uniref:PQQ-like domain-containing protein n=1 Tax=Ruania alba TaxID=648782 RepID=A0A1H5MQW3_9MICO|nr:PQQ-binding-like beta-propeller repeat protein [Ruania alba]SEE91714.1 PQQ-like domain-containing protein [Ruania alba]
MISSPTRPHVRLIAATAVAAVTSLGLASSASGDDGSASLGLTAEVIDRGHIATEPNTSFAEAGTLADGTPVLYISGSGEPASFTVVNAETGELISGAEVAPKIIGGPIQPLPDGSAYFGLRSGSGIIIYHWDAETHEITEAVENPVGERLVRELQLGDDGLLYGSTYPNTKVFSYDPATGEVRDYGSIVDEQDGDTYAEGFSVHDGTAYVGTGMQNGNLVAVDLDSGEISTMEVPAEYDHISRFYRSQQVGDLIAMAFSPGISGGTNTLFWDTAAQDWACDGAIGTFVNLNNPYTESTEDGRFYYKASNEIWEFDTTDCSVTPTGWIDTDLAGTGNHRALSLVTTGEGSAAEHALLGLNRDGSFWRFDPETGEQAYFESQVSGSRLTAHSIHVGPDDRVYMGYYLSPSLLGRFDPTTEEIEAISGPSQADSWATFEGDILTGSYANAVVHRGDPTAEWDWDTNPSQQFRLISEGQDRIIEMATDGALVAMATVSDYGVRGGALTLTDMDERRDTYRDLVDAQSTASVTFGPDGLVYAGTSIRGGLSSQNSPLDAHLVVFDPDAGEVVEALVPVPDNDVVSGLTVVGNSIWGVTNTGILFEYDITAGEVVERLELGTGASSSPWGLASTIQAHPTDGLLYGISGSDVFAFDPHSHQVQILAEDGYKRMDIAPDGTIYALGETNLYEIAIERAPECTTTIDGRHDGPLAISDEVLCVTGGSVHGSITLSEGATLIAQDAQLAGPVHSTNATVVEIVGSTVSGPVTITGTSERTVLSDNQIRGPLSCSDNASAPTDLGSPNVISGPQTGQCSDL